MATGKEMLEKAAMGYLGPLLEKLVKSPAFAEQIEKLTSYLKAFVANQDAIKAGIDENRQMLMVIMQALNVPLPEQPKLEKPDDQELPARFPEKT